MVDEAGATPDERCPSRHEKGVQCERERGHAWLHFATVDGVNYAWSDPLAQDTRRVSPVDEPDSN
jgi:hypothetical protein